jgi:hypothetical protein
MSFDPAMMIDEGESQFQPIEIGGVLLGAVVPHALGFSFIAADRRVADMDNSIWPTPDYARDAAVQLYRDTRPSGVKWSLVGRLNRYGLAMIRRMARCTRTGLQAGE